MLEKKSVADEVGCQFGTGVIEKVLKRRINEDSCVLEQRKDLFVAVYDAFASLNSGVLDIYSASMGGHRDTKRRPELEPTDALQKEIRAYRDELLEIAR